LRYFSRVTFFKCNTIRITRLVTAAYSLQFGKLSQLG
jgi:hypothetical protein